MFLIREVGINRVEAAVVRLVEEAASKAMSVLAALFQATTETDAPSLSEDPGELVITTRRGVRVVVDDERICVRARNEFARADWEEVPALIACLRGAIVPEYRRESVDPTLAQVSLEMASGFGHVNDGGPLECIFTADDAEDITRDYMLARVCPDRDIASEITHVHRIGPRKLFKYIETEVLSV